MSPPDINSRPSSTSNNNTTTSPFATASTHTTSAAQQPTTPRQQQRVPATTPNPSTQGSSTQAPSESGIIPFPRTMSITTNQENNNAGERRLRRDSSGIGSPSSSLRGHSESPRLSITNSLQAAAAVNAGLRSEEDSRRSSVGSITRQRSTRSPHTTARRRSTVLMNLQLNDPALPAPGEMVSADQPHPNLASYSTMPASTLAYGRASPRSMGSPIIPSRDLGHNRAPSLGEIHQELEQEQEAQVNRLLQMIRVQQAQLQALQASHPSSTDPSSVSTGLQASAIEDNITSPTNTYLDTIPSAPASAQISPNASNANLPTSQPIPIPASATTPVRMTIHPRSSFDLSRSVRAGSRTPSRNASPGLPLTGRSPSMGRLQGDRSEEWLGGVSTRDEAQFYQAEAQMMTRENQMLRLRIRELEREVRDRSESSASGGRRGSVNSYEPATPSSLIRGLSARSAKDGEGSRGQSRTERVSEMGAEDDEDASPRTTPAPKTPQAQGEAKKEENNVD